MEVCFDIILANMAWHRVEKVVFGSKLDLENICMNSIYDYVHCKDYNAFKVLHNKPHELPLPRLL